MPEITQEQLDVYLKRDDEVKDLTIKLQEKDKEVEDVRMEVLTPEYTAYLDSLSSGESKSKEILEGNKGKGEDDEFKSLTPKQLYDRAKKDIIDEIKNERVKEQTDAQKQKQIKTKSEIATFAKEHDDFETFRPIMYGLSLDPKYADMNLGQLYEKAKDHVARISGVDPKKRTGKQVNNNEKPSGGGKSLTSDELKNMSNEAIAKKALDEVKEEFGDFPTS